MAENIYRIGWFSTGRDEAAGALLEAVQGSIERGEMKAEIAFVFSNRELGESEYSDRFFDLVRGYNIPLLTLSYRRFLRERGGDAGANGDQRRVEYDRAVMRRLRHFRVDICVLAGYMLIVGEEMCRRYNMLNLHPAAPGGPKGTWQEVIRQLIRNRAQESGVMMHLVTPELDRGPVVTYALFPIRGYGFDRYWAEISGYQDGDSRARDAENVLFGLIREHGLKMEFPLIIATLQAFSQGRVKIEGGRVTDYRGHPLDGYDLTDDINRMAAG